VQASDGLVYLDCCSFTRYEGLHQAVQYGVMPTSNSGKVCFAVVEDVW
jgi:hypothetical protein